MNNFSRENNCYKTTQHPPSSLFPTNSNLISPRLKKSHYWWISINCSETSLGESMVSILDHVARLSYEIILQQNVLTQQPSSQMTCHYVSFTGVHVNRVTNKWQGALQSIGLAIYHWHVQIITAVISQCHFFNEKYETQGWIDQGMFIQQTTS